MVNGGFISEEEKMVSDSLSDVLLFTTLCIIGFPVDVHVKDGSVYSGIFYTACLDHDYAIVLKTARMMKKGKRDANVPNGSLIDTLIIQAEDLVQVVAKDILLPAEGIPGKSGAGDDCGFTAVTPQEVCKEIEENATKPDESTTESSCINRRSFPSLPGERLADGSAEETQSGFALELKSQESQESDEILASRSSVGACENLLNGPESNSEETEADKFPNHSFEKSAGLNTKDSKHERPSSDYNPHPDALSSIVSAPASRFYPTSSTITKTVPPKAPKEFKLNPKAEVFSPSTALHRPATPTLATLANITYMPDSLPVVPIASAEPEIDTSSFSYRSSRHAKYLPHNNLVYGSGHSDQQHSQPILAYVGSSTQPVRYAAQYGHLHPGTAYMHQNSQNVMAGRLGPLVYVHPVSNDFVTYSSGGLPQVPARPVLTPNPVNILKHQGTQAFQIYMTPPFMANGQKPVTTIPSYTQMSQTLDPALPIMGSFPVAGSSLVTKYV